LFYSRIRIRSGRKKEEGKERKEEEECSGKGC
jgi:hypothetical protein